MKVLIIVTKAEIGGAQIFVLNLAQGLKNKGYEVSVAFGKGDFLSQELDKYGIKYFRLKNLERTNNLFSMFLFIKELKNLIDKEKFDIIHFNSSNTLLGVISAKLSKTKSETIFTIHGLSVLDPNNKSIFILKYIYKLYFKFFLSYVDKVVFVSKFNLEEIERQKILVKGFIVYNGLDLGPASFLNRAEAINELNKFINIDLSGSYLIGSVGRLAYPKNYEFLIQTWPEIKKNKPNAKLIIIGEGPERFKYEKLIKSLDLQNDIFLPGQMNYSSRVLKAFDLFILSSIFEGLSVSLIEAVYAGIPALASRVGGNEEIIGVNNCFILNNK